MSQSRAGKASSFMPLPTLPETARDARPYALWPRSLSLMRSLALALSLSIAGPHRSAMKLASPSPPARSRSSMPKLYTSTPDPYASPRITLTAQRGVVIDGRSKPIGSVGSGVRGVYVYVCVCVCVCRVLISSWCEHVNGTAALPCPSVSPLRRLPLARRRAACRQWSVQAARGSPWTATSRSPPPWPAVTP